MVARSAVPFSVGTRVVARSKDELTGLFAALAEEAGPNGSKVSVHTAAGYRKRYGSVPAGVESGQGRLFAVVTVSGDTFTLVLDKRFGAWKVVGLTR